MLRLTLDIVNTLRNGGGEGITALRTLQWPEPSIGFLSHRPTVS